MNKKFPQGSVLFNGIPRINALSIYSSKIIRSWIEGQRPVEYRKGAAYIIEFYRYSMNNEIGCDIEVAMGLDKWAASGHSKYALWAFTACMTNLRFEVSSSEYVWNWKERSESLKKTA